ncbi:helix-turn-helix transcriptional regulator [Chitinilyticum piscinae]|uniref:Helix-turn-helix domain-containing protein n=1 Tax=Chitinilyticum piscinae TaxID=2866724 RepID=A0A8J7KEF5_9NEIS|nr:helix-turn-helix transcriptional regulator [Chitinilyticum piscinae]MBE9609474.1 helix-turn-helix domain-containing protein [Chitinilyticum piscinae]
MSNHQQELADFLKSLRQRCEPAQFGIAAGGRRRTQGLRREEVAQLAGISPTWYTWLEQARDISMSPAVLDRLASALRMDKTQRGYLFELAGKVDPQPHTHEDILPASSKQALVERISTPAYLLGRCWDIEAFNAAAGSLFTSWPASEVPLNLLHYVFFDPAARELVADWEQRARRLVAEFRADTHGLRDDPAFRLRFDRLEQSPEFRASWLRHDVLERQGGVRSFHHPVLGAISYQQYTFRLEQQEDVKLVILTPVAG